MTVTVAVAVIAPVIVAALGNGNDTVGLIDAVYEGIGGLHGDGVRLHTQVSCEISKLLESSTVSITNTVSIPFPSAATIRAADHDHGHVDDPERSTQRDHRLAGSSTYLPSSRRSSAS